MPDKTKKFKFCNIFKKIQINDKILLGVIYDKL